MKVFFYSNHREDDPSIGITKKVRSQISELRRRGYDVYFSAYYQHGIGIFDNTDRLIEYHQIKMFHGMIGHWNRRVCNLRYSGNFLKKYNFSLIYMRFHFWDRHALRFLRLAKKNDCKIIVEAHSYPYHSTRASKSMKLVYFLDRIYAHKVKRQIDLVAAITELDTKIWGCKTVRIENSVNTLNIQIRDLKGIDCDTFQIINVANETSGHGLYRIIKGIASYKGKKPIILNLIGEYREDTKRLIHSLNVEDRIILRGKLYGKDLYDYYNKASIGVGILAGYLFGCHSGIALKTKEYMACGLPFITSASANAEIRSFPYAYVISEDDSDVDIQRLIDFYVKLNFSQNDAEKMHNYAISKYQWSMQFDRIFQELN